MQPIEIPLLITACPRDPLGPCDYCENAAVQRLSTQMTICTANTNGKESDHNELDITSHMQFKSTPP